MDPPRYQEDQEVVPGSPGAVPLYGRAEYPLTGIQPGPAEVYPNPNVNPNPGPNVNRSGGGYAYPLEVVQPLVFGRYPVTMVCPQCQKVGDTPHFFLILHYT